MPGFNKNGPTGQGPLSGRGVGACGTAAGQGSVLGRGRGTGGRCRMANDGWSQGRGLGLGLRFGGANSPVATAPTPAAEDDKEALKIAYEAAQQELASLKRRLDELEGGNDAE